MARIKKKGVAGQARNYITRTQAVRKLQISLPDFRRLCIFKGIYPREPRSRKKASKSSSHSTTFYYTKDIQYLLHEPLLQKFRDQKVVAKRISRSLGRNEINDALRLEKSATPRVKLDHIVRERYPTFIDALRDLDDALSLLFLFANLPSTPTVPPKIIARCQRLCHEFEHYVITSHCLRKSFLSIKGIYYQATIQGQDIMWLVPYRFVQRVSQDIDYRIMGTFVEFYATLLGFVNFRLYTSIGLVYPPKFDVESDSKGGELAAITLEGKKLGAEPSQDGTDSSVATEHAVSNSAVVQEQIDRISGEVEVYPHDTEDVVEERADEIDNFEVAAPKADILTQPDKAGNQADSLFSTCTFFISRESPRHPIEFLLKAFGCRKVGWDKFLGEGAFTHDEANPRITHQIVDRPPSVPASQDNSSEPSTAKVRFPGRIYVQPQWVWDCINEGSLLRPDLYAPGATLPPHLSPWIAPAKGVYDPRAPLPETAPELEIEEFPASRDVREEHKVIQHVSSADADMDVADMVQDESDESEDVEELSESELMGEYDSIGDTDSDDDRDFANGDDYQKELEAEVAGQGVRRLELSSRTKDDTRKAQNKLLRKEAEELERRKMMLPQKKRKLFEKMQYSNAKKEAEVRKLYAKRRRIEKAAT